MGEDVVVLMVGVVSFLWLWDFVNRRGCQYSKQLITDFRLL
jgi:hypothetical protein